MLAGACAPATARTAVLQVGSTTVKVTNPVPDSNPLMRATLLGRGVDQPINAATDGTPCERLGVEITRPQMRIFSPAITGQTRSYTVHSVARFTMTLRPGGVKPALIALNATTCRAIDAGNNGTIVLLANSLGPGIAYSDSDGSGGSCTGTNAILGSGSSGRMVAESSGATTGQLGWFSAPAVNGYNGSASVNTAVPASYPTAIGNYVGLLISRSRRTTRVPADLVYHCTNVSTALQPMCAASTDPVKAADDLAGSSAPAGFTTYTGPCDTTAGSISISGNVRITNCPTFTVKGGTLTIAAGSTVIFNGSVSVEAGGNLFANTTGATDASGYPVALEPNRPTTLIVGSTSASALNMQSTSAVVGLAETFVYNRGGVAIQGSPILRWTPPSAGLTNGLIYWSESAQSVSIQGGPTFNARGVLFQGNGPLTGSGGGLIDLSNVQMWVDTASTSGSTTLRLAADPLNSIGTFSGGSALVR